MVDWYAVQENYYESLNGAGETFRDYLLRRIAKRGSDDGCTLVMLPIKPPYRRSDYRQVWADALYESRNILNEQLEKLQVTSQRPR